MECKYCHIELPEHAVFCCACGRRQTPAPRRRRHRAKAEGSIIKLSGPRNKPYWARLPAEYSLDGVTRKSLGCFSTYQEAAEALGKAMYSPQVTSDNTTLADLYNQFCSSHYFAALAPGSQATHRNSWKHLRSCSNTSVSKINKMTFQRPIDELRQRGLKRETLAKVRNLSSLLCKDGMGLGLLTVNYGQLVQLPKADKTPVRPFSSTEIGKIWDAADQGNVDAMAVLILIYTGMRPSELLDACIEEHLYTEGTSWYFQTGSKTEAGRDRIIPLPSLIHPIITQLLAQRHRGPVIVAAKGGHFRLDNWRNRGFNPLMQALGLKGHTPYSCRHTYADLQKRRRVDPEIMMEIMGHEDYSTTVENYYTTTDEDIERICAAAEGLERPKV